MIANKGRLLLYVITDFDRSHHQGRYRNCRRASHTRSLGRAMKSVRRKLFNPLADSDIHGGFHTEKIFK